MTVELIRQQGLQLAKPEVFSEFFAGNEDKLKAYVLRETIPIGKPGQSCQNNLFLGFFFDGTRNNYATSFRENTNTYSNVARLFDAFPGRMIAPRAVTSVATPWPAESQYPNYLRIYTPGVGTPFEEVDDTGERGGPTSDGGAGAAFARWGERRLIWALCQALNALYVYFKKETFIKPAEVRELFAALTLDGRQLKAAPIFVDLARAANTKAHLERLLRRFHQAVRSHMPQAVTGNKPALDPGLVQHIYVSAFGFSRGATAARAYTNWLLSLCEMDACLTGQSGYTLAGIPVTFDFLGIFDTVASVGTAAIVPALGAHGHAAWADAERSLRVPADVKCLHIVSAHEVRRCFPLDAISVKGQLAAGHREIIMPGVHSDIGGGYAPCEQGRGVDPQGSDMLSRIALAIMYREARLSGAPLKLERAAPVARQRFAVHPDIIRALNAYLAACPVKDGAFQSIMHDQMRLAILWRKAMAGKMRGLASVNRAAQVDINDIVGADEEFAAEVAAFERWLTQPKTTQSFCPRPEMDICVDMEVSALPGVDPDRLKEWQDIARFWRHGPVPAAVVHLLENHVHDSRAWFKLTGTEAADAEAELKAWVHLYDRLKRGGGIQPGQFGSGMSKEQVDWIEAYKRTGKVPAMKTQGREPFELGGGYLRWRRVYAGADEWRLTKVIAPAVGEDAPSLV
ncbi:MAG: DUF2235 domain-containing protein [Aquabacterium sp.]